MIDDYGDAVFRGEYGGYTDSDNWGSYLTSYPFTSKEAAEEAIRRTIMRYKEQQEPDPENDIQRLTPAQIEKLTIEIEGYKKFINSAPVRILLKALGITPRSLEKQVFSFATRDALGVLKTDDSSGSFMGVDPLDLSPAALPVVVALLPIFIVMAGFDISNQEKLRGTDGDEFYWAKVIYFWAPKTGFLSPVTLIKSAVRFAYFWAKGDKEKAMSELSKALGIEAVDALEQIEATQEETEGDLEELPANRDDEKTSNREKLLGALKALEKLEDDEGS